MNKPPPRLRLRVTATAETIVRSRHPWLFADSIREQNRAGDVGELAVVYDRQDKFLAIGLYDPDSPIRVRMLHVGKPLTIDATWWRERFKATLAWRDGLLNDRTTACRLIHGESDGWPGLVLDRYDATTVLKLYTAAWLPRLAEIIGLIREEVRPANLVLRLSRNIQEVARERFHCEEGWRALVGEGAGEYSKPTSDLVIFQENGLRFEADVVKGQKTGFFLDQRENRRRVETYAAGREVLNAFSFSGGFSLYAARGSAKSVTDLDISEHALLNAKRNFALNQSLPTVARCRHETIQGDAFAWLEKNRERQFDLIVLDPPSLAKRESERAGAVQAYGRLAANGIRVLRPNGILVAASCSAHVSAKEFFEMVRGVARSSGRKFEELDATGHPSDHPATFPEAQYLKCIYLRLTPA